ncbi:MAG: molecular chaperone DnaJ [Gemmatimonadota bacterium]
MASAGTKDYYQTLGVGEKADDAEIKKAYRKLAKKYHPDANPNDAAAAERFKEVGEAYGVLADQEKRAQYDRMRRFGPLGGFAGGGARRPSHAGPGGEDIRFSMDDLGDLGGIGDLFGSIFDFGKRQRARPTGARERGRNVEYTVEVSFRLAAQGGKIAITVPITEQCGTCEGSGNAAGSKPRKCPECKGSGTVSFGKGGFAVNRPCPRCLGRGQIPTDPCTVCSGSGEVREQRKVAIKVAAGVDTGSKVRIPGQGERGQGGGRPGDLIVTFEVRPDPFFARDGLDVHCEIPINVAQAALGSKVRVKTVDGKRVTLRVPPGTQSGTKFRIAGQGIEKQDHRGDQYVRVRVTVPEELDEEGRKLMEQFAAANDLRY